MGSCKSNFDAVVREYRDRAADVVDELAYEARDMVRGYLRTGEKGLSNDTLAALASVYVVRAGKVPPGRESYGYNQARSAFQKFLGSRNSRHRGALYGRRQGYAPEEVAANTLEAYQPGRKPWSVTSSVASCSKYLGYWETGWRSRYRVRGVNPRTGTSYDYKRGRTNKKPQFAPMRFAMRRQASERAMRILRRRGRYSSVNAKRR